LGAAHFFGAPRWLASAHLQSFVGAIPLWSPPKSFDGGRAEQLRIPVAEGALAAHAWWSGPKGGPARRTLAVLLVHGVAGSAESSYLVRAAVAMHRAGMHAVRLNTRGAGASVAHAPSLTHAGLTEDLTVAIDALAADPRVAGVAVVGFSLGGNLALKLAGEWKGAPHPAVRAVVSLSAPFDLTAVSRALEALRSTPYRRHILGGLVDQARAFKHFHPRRALYEAAALRRMRTVREYDEAVIAPMHGFASAEDYYRRASSGFWLPSITVPTLILHADDDPLIPKPTVDPWLADASSSVTITRTDRGGHLGWVTGLSESSWVNTWAMERVIAFMARTAPRDS
jgi:predicted alpha/beta-fold hydrolase